jgi:cyclopropane-fatty-acyl-phospholipid synthase
LPGIGQRSDQYDVAAGAVNAWRRYGDAEDKERTNVHYEQPPEFFTTITGGDWHVYSCNLWDGASGETESQERKLDLLASLLELKPGQRVLDVGCGWGGPLVYLAGRFGVSGVGLTLSPRQLRFAQERATSHDADVQVIECHWRNFKTDDRFDAVITDEVIVHFNDLEGYFERVRGLLKPGGRMLNKELHFTNSRYMDLTRAMVFLNKIYGETGNYRMLHDELRLMDEAGFTLERLHQIPLENYHQTLDGWLANMTDNRRDLEALVGAQYFKRFQTYLRIVRRVIGMSPPSMTLDVVVGSAPS